MNVQIHKVKKSQFGDNVIITLKEEVKTSRVYNQNGLFPNAVEYSSVRYCLQVAPPKTTKTMVAKQLAQFPDGRIQRTLSSEPIVTPIISSRIEKGYATLNDIAKDQLVIDGESNQPILYKGRLQFKINTYVTDGSEDIDLRIQEESETAIQSAVQAPSVGFQMKF